MKVEQFNKLLWELHHLKGEQRKRLYETINTMKQEDIAKARYALFVGQRVSFPTKQGKNLVGVIRKINRKNCHVQIDGGTLWSVTATLLKPVEEFVVGET